jgi:hypothetical protein
MNEQNHLEMSNVTVQTIPGSVDHELPGHGSKWPWWRTTRHDLLVLPWFILIHVTAVIGLLLFPLPGGACSSAHSRSPGSVALAQLYAITEHSLTALCV